MAESLRDFTTTAGFTAASRTPQSDELYATPDQLLSIYGLTITEGEIRFAMSILHQVTNRPSLWPEEIEQRISVPDDRMQVILAARPVLRIVAASGRYATGRRDRLALNQVNLDTLASTLVFGSPPAWNIIEIEQIDFFPATGEVWLPTGLFLVNYNEVMIKYISGFTEIPDRALAGLIEIINTVAQKGASDRTFYTVGKVQRQFSGGSFVSQQAHDLLEPYIVRSLL